MYSLVNGSLCCHKRQYCESDDIYKAFSTLQLFSNACHLACGIQRYCGHVLFKPVTCKMPGQLLDPKPPNEIYRTVLNIICCHFIYEIHPVPMPGTEQQRIKYRLFFSAIIFKRITESKTNTLTYVTLLEFVVKMWFTIT